MAVLGATIVLVTVGYLLVASVLAGRQHRSSGTKAPVAATDLRYVVIVPCLDEEQVLGATLDSLLALPRERLIVVVVDDGSTDATAEIARSYDDGRVTLLQRHPPRARQGKGAALNHAFRTISSSCERSGLDPRRIVVGVVDADGRLEPDALGHIDRAFDDAEVGAAQLLVRIKNRGRWLTRFQDFEFVSFSRIMQRARQHLGSVGLGGNGQFARLAALRQLGDEPWTDCLTEDLDLGIRLAMAGWTNAFVSDTWVSQQGVTSVPRLVRQRTRWLHGHWQCWRLIPPLLRSRLPNRTVADLLYYLAAPVVLLLASIAFTLPLVLLPVTLVRAVVDPASVPWSQVLAAYALGFGPVLLLAAVYRAAAGDISLGRALVLGHGLTLYNYVWYLAAWAALGRILLGRTGWRKTAREPDDEPSRHRLHAAREAASS